MNIVGRLSRMETALRRRREDGRIDPATYEEVARIVAQLDEEYRAGIEPDAAQAEEYFRELRAAIGLPPRN